MRKQISTSRLIGLIWLLALLGMAQSSVAQSLFGSRSNSGPLPVEQVFQLHSQVDGAGVVQLRWQIADGYYLYRDHTRYALSEGLVLVDEQRGAGVGKDDPLFGQVDVWYEQAQAWLLLGQENDNPLDNPELRITYQGCWEGGICYPPVTETLPLGGLPVAAGLTWPDGMEQLAPDSVTETSAPMAEHDRFTRLLSGESLWLMLGAFFLAGLALSLTPCVFPMIPILSSIIAGQQERVSTGRALGLSSVYVLAMALTYTLAGVLAGLFGANLQAAFQNPWIISLFSGVFVLLALSMFGFYDLQLPSALQTRLSQASHRQRGGQVTGVAVMGFLSALIVGPCMAAPLAGALIYIGQTGDPLLGGIALFALSLGMGLPLLLVGTSAGRLMPRAGGWMKAVKAGFGVMLLLMAVWMLDRIVPVQVTMTLTALILLVSAVYLNALDRLPAQSGGWQKFWKGVGVILLVYGVALLLGVFAGGRSLVQPLHGVVGDPAQARAVQPPMTFTRVTSLTELEPMLAQAQEVGQPVMLDFYADWCVTCAQMEQVTFRDPQLQARTEAFMRIKVDVTANDADARALYQRFSVFAPPALVFFDSRGEERREMAVHGVIAAQPLLQQIQALN